MCGWMYRKGDVALSERLGNKEVCSRLRWARYYFVADGGAKMLLQFKSRKDKVARDLILLDGAKVLAVGAMRLYSTIHAFKISQRSGKVVYFACEEKAAARSWMRLLRAIVHGKINHTGEPLKRIAVEDSHESVKSKSPAPIQLKSLPLFDKVGLGQELKRNGMGVVSKPKGGAQADDGRVEKEPWLVVTYQEAAAYRIQRQFRRWLWRKRAKIRFEERVAAVRLQAFSRKVLAIKKRNKLSKEKEAATCIQACWRMWCQYEIYQFKLKEISSAKILQKIWRMYGARKLYLEKKQIYSGEAYSFLSQVFERGRNCACVILLSKVEQAVTRLQARQRMFIERNEYIKTQRNLSSIKIQRFVRSYQSRRQARLVRKYMLLRHSAAQKIGMAWRRHVVSARVLERVKAKEASIEIQRLVKGHLARTQVAFMRKELEQTLCQLRSRIAFEFVVSICKELHKRQRVARVIQRRIRAFFDRCRFLEAHQQKMDMVRCAQKIQGVARGRLFRKELAQLASEAVCIQSAIRGFLAKAIVIRLREERLNATAGRIQAWFKSILDWRLVMIQQEHDSYLFGSVGLALRQTVLINGQSWGVRARLLDTCANIQLSIFHLGSTPRQLQATFNGWYILQLLQVYSHRTFTLKQLVALLAHRVALKQKESATRLVSLDPFMHLLRTRTSHHATMKALRSALESTTPVHLRDSRTVQYDLTEIDVRRLEILEHVGEDPNARLLPWEVMLAHICFYLRCPAEEAFCFQPFHSSILTAVASRKVEHWVRTAANNVQKRKANTFGDSMDAQETLAFSVDHALFVHRQHSATLTRCARVQSRVYKQMAQEIQQSSSALKEVHKIAEATEEERADLSADVQRWKESLKELQEKRRLSVYTDDDPRILVMEEELRVLEVEVFQASEVTQLQEVLFKSSRQCERLLRAYVKACHGAMTVFIQLIKLSKRKCVRHQEERGSKLERLKSLMTRMDAQIGVMVGSYAQKSMQLLSRCSRNVSAMINKMQPLVNQLALYSYEDEDYGQVYCYVALPFIEGALKDLVKEHEAVYHEHMRITRELVPALRVRKESALNAIEEAKQHFQFIQSYYKEDITLLEAAEVEQKQHDYIHMKDLTTDDVSEDKDLIDMRFRRLQRYHSILGKQLDVVEERYWKADVMVQVSKVGQRVHDAFKSRGRLGKAIERRDVELISKLTERIFNDLENGEGYPEFETSADELFDILDKTDDILDEVEELEKIERRMRAEEAELMQLEDGRLSRLARLAEEGYHQDGSLFRHEIQKDRYGVVKLFKQALNVGKEEHGEKDPFGFFKRKGRRRREVELGAVMLLQKVRRL